MAADPQQSLTALTRLQAWKVGNPWTSDVYADLAGLQADVSALLDLVTRQQAAIKNLIAIREGEGGTMRINPATGWPLAWGEMPKVEASHDR